ncbi:MAG TPA: iron-sulfur cluster insertion protein ErpA [Candidatus Limnocylindria bacterium]|nr:iron-sulfur cluster insertion protein ErpA [Candidatus Limnocylindria bacterium]
MLNTDPQTNSDVAAEAQSLVVLSDAAAGKLRDLVEAEQNPAIGLRVYVYSGGCSGFRYGMMLEDQPSSEDITVESKGIKVYVDPQSTQYLGGSEIDYLDTLMGAGFTVNNPNAVSACGCGSSFRTSESAGQPGACHH